jgi:hypothetical protein
VWIRLSKEFFSMASAKYYVKVTICEIVREFYEWELHLERCVSCNIECLNKTGLSMIWKCCVHQYIVHHTTVINQRGNLYFTSNHTNSECTKL